MPRTPRSLLYMSTQADEKEAEDGDYDSTESEGLD
jgi:hypothetical protein